MNIMKCLKVIDKLTIPVTLVIVLGFVNNPQIGWVIAGIALYSYLQWRTLSIP